MSPGDSNLPQAKFRWVRSLTRNPVSLLGLAVSIVALANILFLFLIDFISERPSPYIGILGYMVMPGFLILGIILIIAGSFLQRRKRIVEGQAQRYPCIDLNDPTQRSTVAFFASFVAVFVMMSAVGSYKAYEFTDSVQFC